MDRRTFIRVGGTVSGAAMLGMKPAEPEATDAHTPPSEPSGGVPIDREMLRHRNRNRSTVAAQHGMVCTSQPLASVAGMDVLKKGGSAVDAAICANAVLAVVEPMSNGIGGDLFAIVWSEKDQRLFGLNASGRAPYDWSIADAQKLGLEEIDPMTPLAWSVPGCVSGWQMLHERFGSMGIADLLEPAIRYAREGFPLSPVISRGWVGESDRKYPNLFETFCVDGKRPRFGDMVRIPDFANTLEVLAREGFGTFYEGEIADRIVTFSQRVGGRFSSRDFREHTADWVDPVSTSYRGYDVWELPPNGQGIAALQMLNMLEHFDIGALEPNSAEHLHLFVEAKKLAFEDRAIYYADMDFAEVPLQWLISKEYGAERARLIDPTRAAQQVTAGRITGPSDTIYMTAADAEGNMVSLIQSIYYAWGSRYVPDGLGFPIHNRGNLFSLNPDDLNRLEPHKRPFHTIIPAFMTRDGRPVLSFGVMGGDFQPQGHVQVLMNMIDFGMSPQQAGDQPRVGHLESSTPTGYRSVGPGTVGFEPGFADAVKLRLAEMGHNVSAVTDAVGGYQAIWRLDDPLRYFGGSDPRKDGCAVGW